LKLLKKGFGHLGVKGFKSSISSSSSGSYATLQGIDCKRLWAFRGYRIQKFSSSLSGSFATLQGIA